MTNTIKPNHPDGVRLTRCGQFTLVHPPIPKLEQYFYTVHHVLADHPERGQFLLPVAISLIWGTGDSAGPCMATNAGFETLIKQSLEDAGHKVNLAGDRPGPLPAPAMANLADLGSLDVGVLDLVQSKERGLIRYDPVLVDPARLIVQIARTYPEAAIIVTVTRVQDATLLAHTLAKSLPDVALVNNSSIPRHCGRVVVALYSYLGAGAISIERRDIYIALNPKELSYTYMDYGLEGVRHLRRGRMYGLLSEDERPSPQERDRLTASFGVEEVYVPRHGCRLLPVDVVFTPITGGPRAAPDLSAPHR